MPRRTDISFILIIGAGPIVIGQAEWVDAGDHAWEGIRAMMGMPPADNAQAIHAVSRCGIPASRIHIRYDKQLQAYVVVIGKARSKPQEPVLRCIYAAAPRGYDVEFKDRMVHDAYWKLAFEKGREKANAAGRRWLEERGLTEGMPLYRAGQSEIGGFARAAESHCSVDPGSALEVVGPNSLTLRRDAFDVFPMSAAKSENLTCLMNVLAASDLAQGGVHFGFVGNEAQGKRRKR